MIFFTQKKTHEVSMKGPLTLRKLHICNESGQALCLFNIFAALLKDKYPNFEVGLKCIIIVF